MSISDIAVFVLKRDVKLQPTNDKYLRHRSLRSKVIYGETHTQPTDCSTRPPKWSVKRRGFVCTALLSKYSEQYPVQWR